MPAVYGFTEKIFHSGCLLLLCTKFDEIDISLKINLQAIIIPIKNSKQLIKQPSASEN